ncbi:MAG: metallophosphoesterase family protein [Candidatus Methanomethylophilaceae archaeon]|nr:metallophosphoesterase family protein [Candidatus Methanomethylophilaceae archaeon]
MTLLQPVYGVPALSSGEYLVIGDLHIGLESHLFSKGFRVASRTGDMLASVLEAAGDDISRLIVLGDVKDSVPGSTKQEYAEIPDFFESLFERFERIDVVKGNHDTRIEEFLPPAVKIHSAAGLRIGDVGLVHGHRWPSEDVMACRTLVMAHNHPAVMFVDGIGKATTEPCWIRGNFKEKSGAGFSVLPERYITIPAFNRMLGGSPMNSADTEPIGPLLGSGLIDFDDADFYLLDGVYLGKRRDLITKGYVKGNPRIRE